MKILLLTSLFLGSIVFSTNPHLVTVNKVPTEAKKRAAVGNAKILPVGTVYIVIDKSDYELNVYDAKGCGIWQRQP